MQSTKPDETAYIPPFGMGKPHAMNTPGRHSRIDDPEGERHVGRHRSPHQRPPLLQMTGGIAFILSIFGIVLPVGLPSVLAMWGALHVLKRQGKQDGLALWAFWLGSIGVMLSMVALVAVATKAGSQ